jgi:hypothetical protein
MSEQNVKPQQLSGLIYGECTFWITIAGMLVSIAGMLYYFAGNSQLLKVDTLMQDLWEGKNPAYIWKSNGASDAQFEQWKLSNLSFGDGIAMLGISICCFAGVVGAWGAWVGMVISKEKSVFFQIFAMIICILLSCAACGLIYLH